MRGINPLRIVLQNLQGIELPPLRRSPFKPTDPKTEGLVEWGVCVYVFSLIAHLKNILSGLMQLAEAENSAATAPLCRHVFEWAAISCYINTRLKEYFKQHDWEGAWQLLTQVAIGNFWIVKHGSKYMGDPPFTTLKPIFVPNAVPEYENFQSQSGIPADAIENYSYLCEFTHANPACLMRYQEYEEGGEVMKFVDPDKSKQPESFLPFVNRALVDLLTFLIEMLEVAKETTVQPKVRATLRALAEVAPDNLTGSVPQ